MRLIGLLGLIGATSAGGLAVPRHVAVGGTPLPADAGPDFFRRLLERRLFLNQRHGTASTNRKLLTGMVAAVLLAVVESAVGAMPAWRAAPKVYTVATKAVVASDGGGSTGDFYLLTRREVADFVFSFDVTRLPAGGDRLRAIVVWGVDVQDRNNRDSFFLPTAEQPVGATVHFDLVKLGARVQVRRNGVPYSTSHTPYGHPRDKGPVGFLHYYNYHFRYENIRLTSLDGKDLPRPRSMKATVGEGGVVRLSWQAPAVYAGLVRYRVYRRATPGEKMKPILTVAGLSAVDGNVQSNTTYHYAAAAAVDDKLGPRSAEASVRVLGAAAPKPVIAAAGRLRLDGSVRLSWRLAENSRCAGFRILRGATALASRLPPEATEFLTPPGPARSPNYTVVVLDPDGSRDAPRVVRAEPEAPAVRPGAPWPKRHPYLQYSTEDLERVRRLAKVDVDVRAFVKRLCADADKLIKEPPQVPTERTDAQSDARQSAVCSRLGRVAQAYAVSGDEKYAAWARRIMLGYAALYPTFPPHLSGRARLMATNGGLNEVIWYVRLLCAYDLVCDSSVFTPTDRAQIAANLLRPAADLFRVKDYHNAADSRARDLHYKCYNFQAWFDAAVGLTGLFLRDPDLVEHAIDGPYGFKHLLKHDLRDDGIFWERSLGYHQFVLTALFPFLEAAWHCNLDLWRLRVPDDYNTDREPLANYCVNDGDNGPKSLRLMFDGPFYTLYGDRTYADIGDSNRGPLRASDFYRAAYRRYRDPKYAWLYWQDRKSRKSGDLYRGAADLSGTVRMAYDDRFLYVAADVADDIVRNTHAPPAEAWAGDALWLGLKWRQSPGGPYDFIYGLSPGDFAATPPTPVLFNRFTRVHNRRSAGRLCVRRSPAGYTLEFALPWTELTPKPDEPGAALRSAPGRKITVDLVLYDGDPAPGAPSTKEKMLGWSCRTDRYDSAQGGTLVFGTQAPAGEHVINAPRATGIALDGRLDDWNRLPARPARIGPGSAVMTDGGAGADLEDIVCGAPPREVARFDLRGTSFCNNGIIRAGCTLFPSTGFAVLRERLDARGLPPVEAVCCTLTYGPHGGGHGHSDQLGLVLYADGKHWLPDFGSCPYGSPEKGTWTAQTISHNTVVVDETSQYPTGVGTPQWPCDSAARQARGFLDFFRCGPLLKAVEARNSAVYEGVTLRRTAALVGKAMVDFFDVVGAKPHEYDYPLHIDGELKRCSAALRPQPGVLADKPGYKHVLDVRRGEARGAVITEWSDGTRRLRITCAPAPETEVIVGRGLTNRADRTMPLLILRRRAAATVFAAVVQPFTARSPQAVEWLAAPDGVIAARLPTDQGLTLVVFNKTGRPVTVAGLRIPGRLGVRLTQPDGTEQTAVIMKTR